MFVRSIYRKSTEQFYSLILSNSESAHEFAEALKALPRHACDNMSGMEGNAHFMH